MDSPFKQPGSIFEDKRPLDDEYTPEEILRRDEEINEYSAALQDIVEGFGPNNIFIYGQTGNGKTAVTKVMMRFLREEADTHDIDLTILRVNCNKIKSTYALIVTLTNQLREESEKIPEQGLHENVVWGKLYEELDRVGGDVLVVLDEVDKLGHDDTILYEFPRAREMGDLETARVGVIGISNNLMFRDNLSQRVKSTLCETEIFFSPYDANDLREILGHYADLVFKDGVLTDEVIPLCAAFAAQHSGDARQALDLMEAAGNIARDDDSDVVTEEHVREAQDVVERNKVTDLIRDQLTTQMQLTLIATTLLSIDPETPAKVKHIYSVYKDLCDRVDADVYSKRSVHDHLGTIQMYGILEVEERNLGRRGGRAFVYELEVEPRLVYEALGARAEDDSFEERVGGAFPPNMDGILQRYERDSAPSIQMELGDGRE